SGDMPADYGASGPGEMPSPVAIEETQAGVASGTICVAEHDFRIDVGIAVAIEVADGEIVDRPIAVAFLIKLDRSLECSIAAAEGDVIQRRKLAVGEDKIQLTVMIEICSDKEVSLNAGPETDVRTERAITIPLREPRAIVRGVDHIGDAV